LDLYTDNKSNDWTYTLTSNLTIRLIHWQAIYRLDLYTDKRSKDWTYTLTINLTIGVIHWQAI